jgi:pimeloyl-ACP methyl ester carboxylesterase
VARATVNTWQDRPIEIEYETIGDPADPALLLVMGFTAQLTSWEDGFCRLLADGGRYVIRFDNRDCGLSTRLDGVDANLPSVMAAALSGQDSSGLAPYGLRDFAADAVGLLDHLGIDAAHIAGASMGGMIVQTMAIEHPARVRTLTSIMSMTGELEYGTPTAEAATVLMTPPPTDREAYIARATDVAVWSSKRWFDPERARRNAARAYDRAFYPEGAGRQLAAIYASGSRAERLAAVQAPTLVIHGLDDTLITPPGGRRTAELVPGARLMEVADMGHDMPEPLWPELTGAILDHTG